MRDFRPIWWAFGLALFVGLCGIYPHLRFSEEVGRLGWFCNSYDEGYYGWEAIRGLAFHRLLTGVVMKALLLVTGSWTAGMMILADFVLPAAVALAACFALRPLVRSGVGMVAGALFLMMAAELLALRSTVSPTYQLLPVVTTIRDLIDARPGGIFPGGNETTVFWLFRTPEPQMTWVVMFLLAGTAVRFIQSGSRRWWSGYLGLCVLGGFGYFLAMLPLFVALGLAGVGMWWTDRARGWRILLPAAGGTILLFALAVVSSKRIGADSLVFDSRLPVLFATGLIGCGLAVGLLVGCWRRRAISPLAWLALGLAITPLLLANQQIVTGRMLYLLNFENFGFPPLIVMALAATPFALRGTAPDAPFGWGRRTLLGVVTVGLAVVLATSQQTGYAINLESNRTLDGVARTLESVALNPESRVAVEDVFAADNLALKLGWRPNFLLSRDLYYSKSLQRLKAAGDVPVGREALQPRFFEHLALMGVTADEFGKWLNAVVDPADPDWQARFLAGGFFYSQADFWAPLTHARDMKLDWIRAEKPRLLDAYVQFLESDWLREPVVVVGRWRSADFRRFRELGRLKKLNGEAEAGELQAARILPRR